jgi:tetratricopeptide (TPR) repeat protein
MMAKKRIRKHDLKEDQFVTTTLRFTTWVREHQNTVLAGAAIIVVIVILAAVISTSRSRAQQTAARLLGEVEILYGQGRFEQVIEQAQMLLDQYGGRQEAGRAIFYMAESNMRLERYEEAIVAYEIYIKEYHRDKTLTAASHTGIAACYEYLEDFSQAGQWYYQTTQKMPDYYGTQEALMNAGRCYTKAGQIDMAKESYQTLIDNYPESRFLSQAKMELAALEAEPLIKG